MRSALRRLITASGVATLALGAGMTAAAASVVPDFTLDYPAGQACAGFDLGIEGWFGNQQYKEFKDGSGNVVRTISAGTGSTLTFTNLTTLATMTLKSNGSTVHTRFNGDGTSTTKMSGHNILIMFPTDVPAGPSTTLYVGQVVFKADSSWNYTLQSASGRATDICAALTE